MNILGTGLSGLIGTRIVELLSKHFSFEDLSKDTGVDITDYAAVQKKIAASEAPWIFHLAAYTDVDGAEKEKNLGKKSISWCVNVDATDNIVGICQKTGKRLLYLSTDYVFDGTKNTYTEKDLPNPQGWYAITKYEGEKRVSRMRDHGLIFRTANPYRTKLNGKKDFVHKILERLAKDQRVLAPNDQLFIPTLIDDIAYAIRKLISMNASGIFHVVGSQALSPFAASQKIAKTYDYDQSLVSVTTFSKFFKDRAPRPFFAVLKNDKISKCSIHMSTFREGVAKVKQQEVVRSNV